VCTRIEHVHHVSAISNTISNELGLNSDLSTAIALGHDIGHAPFGHQGEKIINNILNKEINNNFWHEQNSLFVADYIETLAGLDGKQSNLNLTYAVRDGLISHCGEIDENGLFPRNEMIDLYKITAPNQYAPYTWEACVVKIDDKIAYLGRDIEDAIKLKILDKQQLTELKEALAEEYGSDIITINTTNLVHGFVLDLCKNSSPQNGLTFSDKYFNLMVAIKEYNYKHIYKHQRLNYYNEYAKLIIETIYKVLIDTFLFGDKYETVKRFYPELTRNFKRWFVCYSDLSITQKQKLQYDIPIVYRYNNNEDFIKAVIMYISLMSDQYALKMFNSIVEF
jgi:dGTPase